MRGMSGGALGPSDAKDVGWDTMTAPPLRPCPACSRHVRASEPSCPFCARQLDGAFRSVSSPRPPTGHLARAALFALGAGGLTVSACSSDAVIVPYGQPPLCEGECNVEPPPDAAGDAIAGEAGTPDAEGASLGDAGLDAPEGN